MCICEIKKESNFESLNDFQNFSIALSKNNSFISTAVLKPYSDMGFDERWFTCSSCGRVWRLVEPDAPFRGCWEVVN